MRFSQESIRIVKNDPAGNDTVKTYRQEFVMSGEWWSNLRLVLRHTVVIGTGDVPIALGGFNILKGLTLKTSRNEVPFSIPGAGLYWLNLFLQGIKPSHDPILKASGEYLATIDIPFYFPFMNYWDDLLLKTKNYSFVELELALGGIADLLGTPGSATLTTKADIMLSRSKTSFLKDQAEKAEAHSAAIFVKKLAPFNPASQPYIQIETSPDLALFGFLAMAYSGASAGKSFTGTPADILDDINWKDNVFPAGFVQGATLSDFKAERNKYAGRSGADLTGMYPHLFSEEGSILSAYPCGGKTDIRLEVGSLIGSPSNPQVDLILFGMRTLR